MRIRINVRIPQWTRWLAIGSVIGLVLGAGATRVYGDQVTGVKTNWAAGEQLKAAELNANFAALKAAVDRIKHPQCPEDYVQDTTATSMVLCKKGGDEVVRVGTGTSAFWIDRYEASVWSNRDGQAGTQVGDTNGDVVTAGLPENGEVVTVVYALSVKNVVPTRYVTWFQAVEACAASGKELPSGLAWLRAARGTEDGSGCNISGSGPGKQANASRRVSPSGAPRT